MLGCARKARQLVNALLNDLSAWQTVKSSSINRQLVEFELFCKQKCCTFCPRLGRMVIVSRSGVKTNKGQRWFIDGSFPLNDHYVNRVWCDRIRLTLKDHTLPESHTECPGETIINLSARHGAYRWMCHSLLEWRGRPLFGHKQTVLSSKITQWR